MGADPCGVQVWRIRKLHLDMSWNNQGVQSSEPSMLENWTWLWDLYLVLFFVSGIVKNLESDVEWFSYYVYDDGQIVLKVVQSPFVLQPFKYDLFIFDASSKVLDRHASKYAVAPPGASCRCQWCLWWHRWSWWQLRRETLQIQGCRSHIVARHQEAWQDARHSGNQRGGTFNISGMCFVKG